MSARKNLDQLSLGRDPAALMESATKQYVDNSSGTSSSTFGVHQATLDASGLTAARTHTLPNESGTIVLQGGLSTLAPLAAPHFTSGDITAASVLDTAASRVSAPGVFAGGSVGSGGILTFGAASGRNFAYIKGYFTSGTSNSQGHLYLGTRTSVGDTSMSPNLQLVATGEAVFFGPIYPDGDNSHSFGNAAKRWTVVYATTGTINTSDARNKTPVAPLTAGEIAASIDLAREIGTFQFLDAIAAKGVAVARQHVGLTVQRAIEIMQAHNLDPMRYGFICYDQWEAKPAVMSEATDAVLDDDGNVVEPAHHSEIREAAQPAGDCYGFRPDELNFFLARGFDARLSALEAKA